MYDVLIVGAGPAGLSAALLLGRCRRRVLICDSGRPRNAVTPALHGFLTRDGIPPPELRRLGRRELRRYSIEVRPMLVTSVRRTPRGYAARFRNAPPAEARFLVLATGVVDLLPDIDGFRALYGRGVFHCPYCDGWEHRDGRLAAYGRGASGASLALSLRTWSRNVVLLTDGPPRMMPATLARLARHGVALRTGRISRLVGHGRLERIEFRAGTGLACDALFFQSGKVQRSRLAEELGCRFTSKGSIRVHAFERAGPPGLYVVGDASPGTQMAMTAAAEGLRAAVAINAELNARDFP